MYVQIGHKKEFFNSEGYETLEQVQGSSGSVQTQAGQSSEELDLVACLPAPGRHNGLGNI